MAVPKGKTSKARKRRRRTHKKLSISVCTNCGEYRKSHNVCPNCHQYNGHDTSAKEQAEA